MNHDWPPEGKTTCLICGASFLASTDAKNGGICSRHTKGVRTPALSPDEEKLFLAISPDGKPILSCQDLPAIPFPRKMIVGANFLNFDGWIIRTSPCSKSLLEWICKRAHRWGKDNPDPVVKSQVCEMLTALERQVVQGSDAEKCIPESRWKG